LTTTASPLSRIFKNCCFMIQLRFTKIQLRFTKNYVHGQNWEDLSKLLDMVKIMYMVKIRYGQNYVHGQNWEDL
jgi:hypothetical protein